MFLLSPYTTTTNYLTKETDCGTATTKFDGPVDTVHKYDDNTQDH